MNGKLKLNCKGMFRIAMIAAAAAFASAEAAAQDNEIPAAPPPLKMISEAERSRLDRENGVKGRTKRSLELMEGRLDNAEAAIRTEDFDKAFSELCVFHALIDDALGFLYDSDTEWGMVQCNFKSVEIGIL